MDKGFEIHPKQLQPVLRLIPFSHIEVALYSGGSRILHGVAKGVARVKHIVLFGVKKTKRKQAICWS